MEFNRPSLEWPNLQMDFRWCKFPSPFLKLILFDQYPGIWAGLFNENRHHLTKPIMPRFGITHTVA